MLVLGPMYHFMLSLTPSFDTIRGTLLIQSAHCAGEHRNSIEKSTFPKFHADRVQARQDASVSAVSEELANMEERRRLEGYQPTSRQAPHAEPEATPAPKESTAGSAPAPATPTLDTPPGQARGLGMAGAAAGAEASTERLQS